MIDFRLIARLLAMGLSAFGVCLTPMVCISLLYGEWSVALVFGLLGLACLLVGLPLRFRLRGNAARLHGASAIRLREGFLAVTLLWLMFGLLGALPYLLCGVVHSPIDAVFEALSGFTTTGATLFPDPSDLPRGILFWRSFTEWAGGLCILLLAISMFPALWIDGPRLARSDDSRHSKLSPKPDRSFRNLIALYCAFSGVAFLVLLLCQLRPFDACLAVMSAISTGGFSNYADGVRHFQSFPAEVILALCAVIGCINFTLYSLIPKGRIRQFLSDQELRLFLGLLLAAAALVSANLWLSGLYPSWLSALRHSFFDVTGFLTTGGGNSSNIAWPPFSGIILLFILLIGSCSNSAGSGIKAIRVIVIAKLIARGFRKRLHPRMVQPIKLAGKPIAQDSIIYIATFLYLYIILFFISVFILSFESINLADSLTLTAGALNNAGAAFSLTTPDATFLAFSGFTKVYLCFLMLVGRLELFTLVLLFMPSFWNPDR